jgi:hypothetical protein
MFSSVCLKGAEARHSKDLTLCRAKVNEFKISEVKYESLFKERITTIKKREKQLIDGITKHSQKLQNEIELERTFARQRVKSLLCLASAPLSSSNFFGRIFSTGSKLCSLCLYEIQ